MKGNDTMYPSGCGDAAGRKEDKEMQRAVITGGTGAIGVALIQKLIEHQIFVVVACHPNSKRLYRIPESPYVAKVFCDMEEIRRLPKLAEGTYDVFYHLAWADTFGSGRDNVESQMRNIEYTLAAVETAAEMGCKRFVGAGSQAEYGRYEGRLDAETPVFPENGYGIAKLCAGQLSRIRCRQLGMEHIWTRVLSVYGPCDGEKTMISSVIRQLLQGEKPSCTRGEQLWDYLYAKDAGEAFRLLGDKGQDQKVYCIGSGRQEQLKHYICCIREEIDPQRDIGFGDVPYGEKQVMHLCADISELTADTGFVPTYSFRDGIKETIEWVKGELANEKNQCVDSML